MAQEAVQVLADRYELTEKLGAGGMAEVRLGRDRVLGRTIAVKTLLSQFASDPSFIARFRREAQSAASLNHPQIVGVYDTGSHDGTHYIVMEFIEGKTLRDVIREEGPLLPERAAEIAADVCAALEFAHQHGIVHRDVKPANIMLTKQGGVKVTDFGIARAMTGDTVTQTAAVLGTAQYFSPEQAQAAPVDARSDIYSLGVVLYEMLTRQVPFTGSSPVAIAYKHVKEDPIPPSRLNPDVPPPFEAIVMKALAKNPGNRYQSAQEMRADLQRALHGKPVSAEPVMMPPIEATGVVTGVPDETVMIQRPVTGGPPPVEPKRRRLGVVLLALIILGIVGVLIWALTGIGKDKTEFVRVPSLIGLKADIAQAQLTRLGLKFTTTLAPSDEYEAGLVSGQDPAEGTRIAKGKNVKLVISQGERLVKVPDVRGKTRQQAEQLLEAAGLQLGIVTEQPSDKVAKGLIISQNPVAGASIKPNSTVEIVVSSGKQTAIVPDVLGQDPSVARQRLEDRGFKVPQETFETSNPATCPYPPGKVCRQDPDGGTTAEFGSTVRIVVAQDVTPTATSSPTSSPTATPTAAPFVPALLVFARRRVRESVS